MSLLVELEVLGQVEVLLEEPEAVEKMEQAEDLLLTRTQVRFQVVQGKF
jgi:hypothetical protein